MASSANSDNSRYYPASYGQEAMWVDSQLHSSLNLHNLLWQIRFSGPLDPKLLTDAVQMIVNRHEPLRSSFQVVNGNLLQIVSPVMAVSCPLEDLSSYPDGEKDSHFHALAQDFGQHHFDIEKAPLVRFQLVRLGEEEHRLLVSFHHLVTDGSSWPVFIDELSVLYAGEALPPPACSYSNHALEQKSLYAEGAWNRHREYWSDRFSRGVPVLDIPLAKPLLDDHHSLGGICEEVFPSALKNELKILAVQQQSTLFRVVLAAFVVLLHRLTGEADVVLGTILTGRPRREMHDLIGLFVNPAPLRIDLEDDSAFIEVLEKVHRELDNAVAHEEYPYHMVLQDIKPVRDFSHRSLIPITFTKLPSSVGKRIGNLHLKEERIFLPLSHKDISFYSQETPEGIRVVCEYESNRFDSAAVNRLMVYFRTLLEGIASDSECPIDDLPLLTDRERTLLVEWNDTNVEYPRELCVHHLFEAQVERTPNATAVICGTNSLTYRELDHSANRLAHYLHKRGVGSDIPVGLCIERTMDMAVALLGILKAGGAYVPISPDCPSERALFMMADTESPVLVIQESLRDKFTSCGAQVVSLEREWPDIMHEPADSPRCIVKGGNLAYIIYTSGSTGKPKGVEINHSSVVNHNLAVSREFGIHCRDKVLQFASLAFDAAVEELFPSWMSGASVVLAGTQALLAVEDFADFIEKYGITVLNLPTQYWYEVTRSLLDSSRTLPPSVRVVIVGGEKVTSRQLDAWLTLTGGERDCINTYGPTETTVISTLYALDGHNPSVNAEFDPPIGRPIANTSINILDRKLRPVPIGVTGELYIGGVGLARGYLNRPELTAEKFILDPYAKEPGARLYRTGDLARYLPDGNIEFLGRIDQQVKVRGFRIELGEIEAVLGQHPGVRESVVLAREDVPGNLRLVAYVVPKPGEIPTIGKLRRSLAEKLPDYMLPSSIVTLDALPLTPSGKVDRRSLPAPDNSRPELEGDYVAPQTPVEQAIAEIWAEVLRLERVGVHDNFFHIGGHSLLATQVISRIRNLFQVEIPLRSLFEAPTIAGIAQNLVQHYYVLSENHKGLADVLADLESLSEEEV